MIQPCKSSEVFTPTERRNVSSRPKDAFFEVDLQAQSLRIYQ
jgi:hypothetical protein